jgi:hypothetical protein
MRLLRGTRNSRGARDALAEAHELTGRRRFGDAIDLLAGAFRQLDDDELATALVDVRIEAARHHEAGAGRSPWPPEYADPWPDHNGRLPEIEAHELTTDLLGGAVLHHGALIVRGVFDRASVTTGVEAIDRARANRDSNESDGDGWFRPVPFDGDKGYVSMNTALRQYVRNDGGTWLADSPRATAIFLDQLTASGVVDAISGHLGERPFISVQKSTMRRTTPEPRFIPWHQDGSFLGPHVRTMNVWIALSRCGGDYPSPGLQVAPFRVPQVLPTDPELPPNAISAQLVADVSAEAPVVVPAFDPGDAILFDERFLHRTYVNKQMTEDRYAIECWFFAPSHPASEYLPLLV